MEKRVSARGIIIENDTVVLMFRRKITDGGNVKEYYVVPGGGVEQDENLEEAVLREIKEELNVDVKILGYLGKDEADTSISHFFHCEIINGIPALSGEELQRHNHNNYYEIRYVKIEDIDYYDVSSKEMIKKALKKQYA